MNRTFEITFSRGSGYCYDEIVYAIGANSLEEATEKANQYRDKHFSRGWYMDIVDMFFESDDNDTGEFRLVSSTFV